MLDRALKDAKILIVDDESLVTEILETFLESAGYSHVSSLADSTQAMGLIEETNPDLLILDLMMPAMSGFDILTAVRAHPVQHSLPVIILTAAGDNENKLRALELAVSDFLTKPIQKNEFSLRVRNVLATRAYERQLAGENQKLEELVGQRNQELLEKEKILNRKMAEVERFAYTLSHEMRTPLVTILGFIGQLQEDLEKGEMKQVEVDLEYIRSAGVSMSNLLQNLLHLVKSGQVICDPQRVNLSHIAQDAMKMVHLSASRAQAEVSLQAEIGISFGDPVRLLEVFQNLLDNAIKFSAGEEMPRIEIGSRRENGRILCFVKDNGIGIEPAYHEKIFGLFDKLNPAGDGVGIGLALVRRIVEEHGGRVWAESAGNGAGTTFWFTLPDHGS